MKKDPTYVEAIANTLVLTIISGNDPKELTEYVQQVLFRCTTNRF